MANIIHKLSETVANQIAAGEVVQRPASVVKELLENAIDAGSSMVIVNIEDGGKELIQIIDDGVGMSYEDALTAFERHATSKITLGEDLQSLTTFGFRGEALPSIASISEVVLKTCRDQDDLGTIIRINGGILEKQTKELTTKGTQISIKKLFYNVPARRKFLKSTSSETKHIINEFKKIALCNAQVSLFLYSNTKPIYNLPIATLRHRVNAIIGKNVNSQLMEISVDTSIVEIKGYIGTPDIAIQNPEQFMFVNGRYFRNAYLNKAISRAFENIMPNNKQTPRYFLYFSVDPAEVDVNVHPQKTEVKFENDTQIWQILYSSVKAVLGKNGIAPTIDFDVDNQFIIPANTSNKDIIEPQAASNTSFNPFNENFSFSKAVYQDEVDSEDSINEYGTEELYVTPSSNKMSSIEKDYSISSYQNGYESSFSNAILPQKEIKSSFNTLQREEIISSFESATNELESVEIESRNFKGEQTTFFENSNKDYDITMLGECALFSKDYIIAPIGDCLLLVNTYYALSRIYYDSFINKINNERSTTINKLMFPITIPLSITHKSIIEDCKPDLNRLGFEITDSDLDGAIEIHGVPSEYEKVNMYEIFEEILDSLSSDDKHGYNNQKRKELITRLSASAAMKKAASITSKEYKMVVSSLLACELYNVTEKGKQIFIEITKNSIDKLIK